MSISQLCTENRSENHLYNFYLVFSMTLRAHLGLKWFFFFHFFLLLHNNNTTIHHSNLHLLHHDVEKKERKNYNGEKIEGVLTTQNRQGN